MDPGQNEIECWVRPKDAASESGLLVEEVRRLCHGGYVRSVQTNYGLLVDLKDLKSKKGPAFKPPWRNEGE